ncbi:MAG: DNA polymerase III subunit gamma/tau C-terminal domain-containing protein, partial [Pseudomonadales bacterium]
VFDAEGVSYDDDGLWIIARAASGSMRDALSLADQAIAFGGGSVMGDAVNAMLGTVDQDVLTQLLAAIVAGDADKALSVINAYAERAPDFVGLVDELLKLIHRIAVEQAVPGAGSEGQLYRKFIHDYAGLISPEDLQMYYQSLLVGKRDLALAPDPITGIEMIVLRLFAFRIAPADGQLQPQEVAPAKKSVTEAVAESSASASAVAPKNNTVASDPVKQPFQSPAAALRDNFDSTPTYSAPVDEALFEKTLVDPVATENVLAATTTSTIAKLAAEAEGETSIAESGVNPLLDSLTPQSWCEMFSALPLSGVVRTVASYCVPIEAADDESNGKVAFALAEDNTTLFNDEHPERLAKGLSIYYGKPITVDIRIIEDWSSLSLSADVETPADYRLRIKTEVQDEALASLQEDGNVQAIIDVFDGELVIDTVRSL